MSVLVVLDVDSTLIQQEVIELLADHVGLMSEVKEITDRAMAGEIDFSESLLRRVELLAGVPESTFEQVTASVSLTPGARELIDAVHLLGGKVGAVSGGFSQVLETLATEIGLDYWKANTLEVSEGKLTGRVVGNIVDAVAKEQALIDWAQASGTRLEDTVAIGDGANDIEMLKVAGFSVGFRPKEILRQYSDLVIEENSLLPVIACLPLRSS